MHELSFPLIFRRPAGSGKDAPAVAESVRFTTKISARQVKSTVRPLQGAKAVLQNRFRFLDSANIRFQEWGEVAFGSGESKLFFSGEGIVLGKPDSEARFTQGTAHWRVVGGTGFFHGAVGAISSNFLVDLDPKNNELIDRHVYVLYLPG